MKFKPPKNFNSFKVFKYFKSNKNKNKNILNNVKIYTKILKKINEKKKFSLYK